MTAKYLRIYADLLERGRSIDSDIVPLMRAGAFHISSQNAKPQATPSEATNL